MTEQELREKIVCNKQPRKNGRFCKTHGHRNERLYEIWCAMKTRCCNPKNKEFHSYGGKGITVCEEWLDYSVFRYWAYSNGYDENAKFGKCTIDRIDNSKGYSPYNCRFVNFQKQIDNQEKTIKLLYKGEIYTIRELAFLHNMQPKTLYNRIHNIGMSLDKALSEPVQTKYKRKCLKQQAEKELQEEKKDEQN